MANEQNLIPGAHKLTLEEQSAGGKKSGEARKKKRLMKDAFEALLSKEYHDAGGNTLDGTELLALKVFKQAMDGDLKAFEIVRDTTGQKPVERVEQVNIDEEYKKSVEYIKEVMRSSE